MKSSYLTVKKLTLAALIATVIINTAFAACPTPRSESMTVDTDNDGLPDPLDWGIDGYCVKNNDIFKYSNQKSLDRGTDYFRNQMLRDFMGREFRAGMDLDLTVDETGSVGLDQREGERMLTEYNRQERLRYVDSFLHEEEFRQNPAAITRLYKAYFNRVPDHGGLWYWANFLKGSNTLANLSATFLASPEFKSTYGQLENTPFVNLVYQNVLGRSADAAGRDYWVSLLAAGKLSRADLMIGFSESAEHVSISAKHVDLVLLYEALLRRNLTTAEYISGMQILNNADPKDSYLFYPVISDLLALPEYHERFLPPDPARIKLEPTPTGRLNGTGLFGDKKFSFTNLDTDGYTVKPTDYLKLQYGLSCVKDNVTGLIWQKYANDDHTIIGASANIEKMTNFNLLNTDPSRQAEIDAPTNTIGFVNLMNSRHLCGASDWRLPTAYELLSLFSYGNRSKIDTAFFDEKPGATWSSTLVPYERLQTQLVGDTIFSNYPWTKYNVRLVRGGNMPALTPRYVFLEDGNEVLDRQTNLIWRRCNLGSNFIDGACENEGFSGLYADIVKETANFAAKTGKAWRVPNIKELYSLVEYEESNPDEKFFFDVGYAWSSSPYISDYKGEELSPLSPGQLGVTYDNYVTNISYVKFPHTLGYSMVKTATLLVRDVK